MYDDRSTPEAMPNHHPIVWGWAVADSRSLTQSGHDRKHDATGVESPASDPVHLDEVELEMGEWAVVVNVFQN